MVVAIWRLVHLSRRVSLAAQEPILGPLVRAAAHWSIQAAADQRLSRASAPAYVICGGGFAGREGALSIIQQGGSSSDFGNPSFDKPASRCWVSLSSHCLQGIVFKSAFLSRNHDPYYLHCVFVMPLQN